MSLELENPGTITGGRGCEDCIYWGRYGEMSLEMYGLVGDWGRCSNIKQIKDINRRHLSHELDSNERVNTDLIRLDVGASNTILSTTSTFDCPNMQIPGRAKDSEESDNEGDS